MAKSLQKFLKRTNLWLTLPVLTGALFGFSALPSQYWYLNFIAFIPLLIAAEKALAFKKPLLVFSIQLFIALAVFYLWAGRWVLQTANMGFLLGLLIVVPFVVLVSPYSLLKKRGSKFAPVYFVAAWLAAEMIQSYFQLSTPFYNLGHSIAKNPKLIQWYEYTGAAGGSLWVLAVNLSLYSLGKGK